MDPVIKQALLSLLIATPIAVFVIRLLFKNSILFKITSLWLFSLLFLVTNTRLSAGRPDLYPYHFSMPIAIVVIFFIAYFAYRIIRIPLKQAMHDLEKVSKGDLTVKVDEKMLKRNDEMGVISRSIDSLSKNFEGIIRGVQQSFMNINEMGAYIKQSSSNMARSSALQAGNLEEISTSMEELVETIMNNSENAESTKTITLETNKSIKVGNDSVLKALNSIREITEKIKIINDISYQTNILAINASVEAARAGEHGTGFAVVAKEVRNLSHQSKEAAIEIDEVSTVSSESSNEAMLLLKEIVPKMEKTTMLVQKIVSATTEQNAGVSQINNAIQELNNTTQQNATDSERMAQSALDLSNESEKLSELIKYFKTH